MKVAIAGTGYVGLVTGVCLAEHGHEVTCVDINKEKIILMESGVSPIYEQGLEELMIKNKDRLRYTTDYKSAYKNAQVIFIGVGTPEKRDGSANLNYVYHVAEQIAEVIENDCVVVVKSTVPIGTNDRIEALLRSIVSDKLNISVVSNPEFLSQGTAVQDTLYSSRIIIGTEDDTAANMLRELYKDFNVPILVTNRRSAEMIKYASNDFLALRISYVNEIANLCELVGADIDDVTKGMGFDSRIGDRFLNAGIGYGGSCFPKDTKALHWLANFYDHEMKTIKAAIDVNENQKFRLIKKARKYFNDFKNVNVAVLGLTFKPGTDDIREAPSLVNIPILLEDGANIKVWDSVGIQNFKKIYADSINYCISIEETLVDTDICFIFTDWEEIKRLKPEDFEKLMNKPIVLDGRNCFNTSLFEKTGVTYESIGRKPIFN